MFIRECCGPPDIRMESHDRVILLWQRIAVAAFAWLRVYHVMTEDEEPQGPPELPLPYRMPPNNLAGPPPLPTGLPPPYRMPPDRLAAGEQPVCPLTGLRRLPIPTESSSDADSSGPPGLTEGSSEVDSTDLQTFESSEDEEDSSEVDSTDLPDLVPVD
jgi:hypothetical protein